MFLIIVLKISHSHLKCKAYFIGVTVIHIIFFHSSIHPRELISLCYVVLGAVQVLRIHFRGVVKPKYYNLLQFLSLSIIVFQFLRKGAEWRLFHSA